MIFRYVLERSTKKKVLQHTLFWIAIITYLMVYFWRLSPLNERIQLLLINLPGEIFFVYFTLYYLLPKFLLKNRYFSFLILFTILGYLIEVSRTVMIRELIYPEEVFSLQSYFIHAGHFNVFYT